jgi:hypothetical protein
MWRLPSALPPPKKYTCFAVLRAAAGDGLGLERFWGTFFAIGLRLRIQM